MIFKRASWSPFSIKCLLSLNDWLIFLLAGERGGGGEQASGPRAARRTGDRQAGDGPESDRAQRSEKTSRLSLGRAADLEGVRSATVGVGGRPSCGEEGGRQVRVVRVALHRPVERHSSGDRSKACRV